MNKQDIRLHLKMQSNCKKINTNDTNGHVINGMLKVILMSKNLEIFWKCDEIVFLNDKTSYKDYIILEISKCKKV